jgi:hypothetical protein
MKYYIGEIHERNGDMEYDSQYLFATNKNPDKYTDAVAMQWRQGDRSNWNSQDEGYWSECTLIFDRGSQEIPESDFNVLKKYLAVF